MNEPWIDLLRAACDSTSQTSVARKVGYSSAVISQVLSGTYAGDVRRVQAAVEGALMNVTVECPVLGEISRAQCIAWQRRPFTPTNPLAVQMYRACRSGCPHSFLPASTDAPAVQPAVTHNSGSRGAVHTTVSSTVTSHGVTRSTGRRKRPTHSTEGDKA